MDWDWHYLKPLLIVAGAIAVWLKNRRGEQAGRPADYDQDDMTDNRAPSRPWAGEVRELPPVSRDGTDPEQAERVRRIQEEIRRKIAERRGQAAPPPMPAPALGPFNPQRPLFREQPSVPAPRSAPPPMASVREVVTTYDDAAALERQKRMAEQLAELEERRHEARRAAQALAEAGPVFVPTPAQESARAPGSPAGGTPGLTAGLRDPRALRRAMVLREILDPPLALRDA